MSDKSEMMDSLLETFSAPCPRQAEEAGGAV